MNQLQEVKNLYIKLTPPPPDAPPNVIATFALFGQESRQSQIHGPLLDPLSANEHKSLFWYLEEYWKWPYLEFATRGRQVEALLIKVGQRLYHAVFGSVPAQDLVKQWLNQADRPHQITIVSDLPRVLGLPWELLHDEHSFVAFNPTHPISIVRSLPQDEQRVVSTPFEPPLRILLVTARPQGEGLFIDPRSIAYELLDEVQDQIETGGIALEFLRPPTVQALHSRLIQKEQPVHVLHFDGHGMFDEKQGMLLFETETGRPSVVKASQLAKMLQTSNIQLVVLTACQSAMGATNDAFSSVAMQLLHKNGTAVVAMSASLLVDSASRYVEAFYRALAASVPPSLAQEQARQALYKDPRRHLYRRRRDEEEKPIELQDWWLPHFYQGVSLILQPVQPEVKWAQQQKLLSSLHVSYRLNEEVSMAPPYGFSGRSRELLQIERWLLRKKLVVIHGFSGVGKTALAREAADWLTRTDMYSVACFVPFEHGGDSVMLLNTLGRFLHIYDRYDPRDHSSALTQIASALKERSALVIADNLESILPGGENPLDQEERVRLWNVLLELAKMGVGVLLTSRDPAVGDGQLSVSNDTATLTLQGLDREDAYTLAIHLLDDREIDRARAPYAELRDLLSQLDHHPMAIQLVLPALHDHDLSISTLRSELSMLLPRFVDDTTTGRNQSLLASLDYSLRRLGKEERSLLPHLALLEGGASEDDLLAITGIAENEWTGLRQALEKQGLLTVEQIHRNISVPFLHFHPIFSPFLHSQYGVGDQVMRQRFAEHYIRLVTTLFLQYNRDPQSVQARVQRELPNLRRALELLLELGKGEDAITMFEQLVWFLTHFGLERERDELRKLVEAKTTAGTEVTDRLTYIEYILESDLAQDEWRKGNTNAAYSRFTALLERIEALPEGAQLGPGSFQYCLALGWQARCLADRYPAIAERRLGQSLATLDTLIRKEPYEADILRQERIRQKGMMLCDLGDMLRDQGRYQQARKVYEEGLKISEQQGDLRAQYVTLRQLAQLAGKQGDHVEAQLRYTASLNLFPRWKEPRLVASSWHQLGDTAREQEEWEEAERCYRESLAIYELHEDEAHAAIIYNQLANLAIETDRRTEAEGWYRRAIALDERAYPGSPSHAIHLNNFANLLMHEIKENRAPMTRLIQTRSYAEQALAIWEAFEPSSKILDTLAILAGIANLEGQTEAVQAYHRRIRQIYISLAENRSQIDKGFGRYIATIAAAVQGDRLAQVVVDAFLPELEQSGWQITSATRHIYAGERNWEALVEDLDENSALLIFRILETIAQPPEVRERRQEAAMAALPTSLRATKQRGDEAAFEQAFEALSLEEQLRATETLQTLEELQLQAEQELSGRAYTLSKLGDVAWKQGEYSVARHWYDESLTLFERLGDQSARANRLLDLGNIACVLKEYEEARRLYSESQATFEQAGDQGGRAKTFHSLGILAQELGEYEEAQRWYSEGLAAFKQVHDKAGEAKTQHQQGTLAQKQRKYEEARGRYSESLAIKERMNDYSGQARTLGELGNLALELGEYEEAWDFYTRSLTIFERVGDQIGYSAVLQRLWLIRRMKDQ